MPTLRQTITSKMTRMYPFYSGCGSFPNMPIIHKLAGVSNEQVFSRVFGGEVLAPLDDYVGRSAFYVGDLDRKITWICKRIVRPGDTVLDIGANIGIVSLCLSSLVGPKGTVHSLEPNPILQELLRKTISHNQVTNIKLHPVALGAQQGVLDLRIPRGNAGSGSGPASYLGVFMRRGLPNNLRIGWIV